MALKLTPSSSSTVLSQQGETKSMLRGVMQRSKSQSHLLAEAMKTYEAKEEAYLSTIQKITEKNKELLALHEKSEAKYSDLLFLYQRNMNELSKRIDDLLDQETARDEQTQKICQEILHCQDQQQICLEAHYSYHHEWDGVIGPFGNYGYPGGTWQQHVAFLKLKLDDVNKSRIEDENPLKIFSMETEGKVKSIQHLSKDTLKEHNDLKVISKTMTQEIKKNQEE